jgi:hypothetical protein
MIALSMITSLLVLFIIGEMIVYLIVPENKNCNQDCNQGRDCDCGDKSGL